ncbi:MAG TPA: hypothetical protein VF786_03020 [Terriglobales bacterium]
MLRELPPRRDLLVELRVDALRRLLLPELLRDLLFAEVDDDRRDVERPRDVDRLLLDLVVVPARRRPVALARFLPVDLRAVDLFEDELRERPVLLLRLLRLLPLRLRVPVERRCVCAIRIQEPLRAEPPQSHSCTNRCTA